MKMTVRLDSYALCGSGEGAGLIDSDIVHDCQGIPYLPGRRLKGLLKESAMEVSEMLGMASPALVNHIFGDDGFQPGIVRTPNLFPMGHDASWDAALSKLLEAQENTLITPATIRSDFTAIRQQTAIGQDGVALNASLRIGRMLKPGIVFCGDLIVADRDPSVSALLWLAVRNLRRIGTRRNRGQGTTTCVLSCVPPLSVQSAIDEVRKWKTPVAPRPAPATMKDRAENDMPARLVMTIRTLSPVVLAVQAGEQNTVNTAPFIPASTVKGILVGRGGEALGLQKGKEHESPLFRKLFLDAGEGSLFASPAFPVINGALFTPAPLYLHQDKAVKERLHNLLAVRPSNTKPVCGLISLTGREFLVGEPDTVLFFHTQRAKDRKQGKSKDEDGAIFYYEAIERNQEFVSTMHGPRGLLDLICSFGPSFSASIGRSRSAQYGRVLVTLNSPLAGDADNGDDEMCDGDETLLTCLSPLIVRNRLGFPEASAANLENCLAEALAESDVAVRVVSAHARTTTVEPFVGVLGCRLPGCEAFSEGSSFLLKVTGGATAKLSRHLERIASTGLGEWRAIGFGAVKFSQEPTDPSYEAGADARSDRTLASIGHVPDGLKALIGRIARREEEAHVTDQGTRAAKEFFPHDPRKRLNNHQIGRLEAFVAEASSVSGLQDILKDLRENAKNKLKACRSSAGISIHEEFTSFVGLAGEQIEQFRKDHKKLLALAGIPDPTDDDRFRLAKCYWLALLRRLRKLNKEEKQP